MTESSVFSCQAPTAPRNHVPALDRHGDTGSGLPALGIKNGSVPIARMVSELGGTVLRFDGKSYAFSLVMRTRLHELLRPNTLRLYH
jgi:hypothetical protein